MTPNGANLLFSSTLYQSNNMQKPILSSCQDLLNTLKHLIPTVYLQETLESILAMFLEGIGHSLPHHCTTSSESAISRFLNYYQWSTRSVIRAVRQLDFGQNQRYQTSVIRISNLSKAYRNSVLSESEHLEMVAAGITR